MTDSSSKKISVAGSAEMGSIKTVNEDAYESYTCGPHKIYLIASGSGIGTSGKGKVALDMVLAALGKFFKEHESTPITHEEIVSSIRDVNREVFERSLEEPKYAGMAVSLSMALITEERIYVVHVGNTRMYMISGPRIEQLTKEHTLAEELKRTGAVGSTTPSSPMSQVLTRAIGKAPHIEPDVFSFALADLDDNRLFVCTKGIYNRLEDHELLEELLEGAPDVVLAKIIKTAKEKNPADNLALAVIDPNGYKGESSGASSEISSSKSESTQEAQGLNPAKDDAAGGDKKPDLSSAKPEDSKVGSSGLGSSGLAGANADGSKTDHKQDVWNVPGTSGGLGGGAKEVSSASPPPSAASPSPWGVSSSSGGSSSAATRPSHGLPSSPLSALVVPSVESTGARAGVDQGPSSSPGEAGGEATQKGSGAGLGQAPPGFEQESSGHLQPRGAGFGSNGAAPGASKGLDSEADQARGGDPTGFSSRKTSTSLEATVAGRGEPKFDEDDGSTDIDESPSASPRSALSKLARAIFVGVIGGTLLGRVFNSSPTEQVKPVGNPQQQVAEVGAKGQAKKSALVKDTGLGTESRPQEAGAEIVADGAARVVVPEGVDARFDGPILTGSGAPEKNVKPELVDEQDGPSGLERALGRRSPEPPSPGAMDLSGSVRADSPMQNMRARAGLSNLTGAKAAARGAAVGSVEGPGVAQQEEQGRLDAGSTRGRGLPSARTRIPSGAPQVTATEVLNKFPQLSKITDPDLKLMLTDVLTAFEETAQISKQELVGVEAERQNLNARLDVLERHIMRNIEKTDEARSAPEMAATADGPETSSPEPVAQTKVAGPARPQEAASSESVSSLTPPLEQTTKGPQRPDSEAEPGSNH